ncbi:MAG: DNA polymerase III subunit delta [Pleomorphochaeta sp.]
MSNIKLFLGPEIGTKDDKIKQELNNLRRKYSPEVEIKKYYSFELNEDEMYVELNNPSLFNPHTLIVLYAIDQLNSQQAENLISYIKNPSDSATLILESELFSLKSPLTKASKLISKSDTSTFYPLTENDLVYFVKNFFKQNKLQITNEAINLLLELVDNNTLELKIICNQLAFFFNVNRKDNNTIDEMDIQKYVHHSKNENSFTLLEMIFNLKLKEAIEISHVLLERDATFAYTLTGGLLWGFRRLLSILESIETGNSSYQAMQNATVMGMKKAVYRKDELALYNNAIRNYKVDDCRKIISLLIDSDVNIRTNTGDLLALEIEQLLYKIIIKKGKSSIKLENISLMNKL